MKITLLVAVCVVMCIGHALGYGYYGGGSYGYYGQQQGGGFDFDNLLPSVALVLFFIILFAGNALNTPAVTVASTG